jgi:hypothetical protein
MPRKKSQSAEINSSFAMQRGEIFVLLLRASRLHVRNILGSNLCTEASLFGSAAVFFSRCCAKMIIREYKGIANREHRKKNQQQPPPLKQRFIINKFMSV